MTPKPRRAVVLLTAGAAVALLSFCGTIAPEPESRTAKWRIALGLSTSGPPAIGPDGTIYVQGPSGLRALRPDGTAKWAVNLSPISSPVVGADGTVYIVTQDVSNYTLGLSAVDPAGSLKWRRQVLPTTSPSHPAVAIGADGTVYCAVDTFLLAVAPDSTLKWRLPVGHYLSSPPVIGRGGTIYVCSDWAIFSVSPAGVLNWRDTIPERISDPPVIGADDRIYYASNRGELVALDAAGQEQWRHRGDVPVIGADRVMRFWGGHDSLCELHPDGTLNMRQTAGMGTLAVVDDGTLYCARSGYEFLGTADAGLDVLNPDGTVRWTFKATGDHCGAWSPIVGPDGTVYLSTIYNLYALADSGSTQGCWWPMYQHDCQHTGRAR